MTKGRGRREEAFVVKGLAGRRQLAGSVTISGSKNAALPVLAATCLFENPVKLQNIPSIEDIWCMQELLGDLGAVVETPRKGTCIVDPRRVKKTTLNRYISQRLRASIILSGPLLARHKRVAFPHPGGCVIGERPIDIFLKGFQEMGARVNRRGEQYVLTAPRAGLTGADLFLRVPSVTATETFVMAAILARGITTIRNAALEPEVESLLRFLSSCGASISGIGTPTLTIHGGSVLKRRSPLYRAIPDRLEAGCFLIFGALCAKELVINRCNPDHLRSFLNVLSRLGVIFNVSGSRIVVRGMRRTQSKFTIKTHEYPGFPTDLQAPLAILLTQARGEHLIFETIFDERLQYLGDLVQMGADVKLWDAHRATIYGPTKIRARTLRSPDIRAGLAFLIAAAVAVGESTIHNVYAIDRGYERIEKKLQRIGLSIERVEV